MDCRIAAVVGLPIAWLLTRSLHQLSKRWAVFVPAGAEHRFSGYEQLSVLVIFQRR